MDFFTEEIPVAIKQSQEGIQHIASIVQAMKEFSHPGAKTRQKADINKGLVNTVNVSKNKWKYLSDIKFELAENLPGILCLPGELNQVFLNIIINAVHAIEEKNRKLESRDKGLITISTEMNPPWIDIRFKDTGGGVPAEMKDKIFDPFFTTKQIGNGTGQGLAIAYDIINNKHRGIITIEETNSKGSVFLIRLPIEQE